MSAGDNTPRRGTVQAVINGRPVPLLTRAQLAREFPDPRMVLGADHTKATFLHYHADRSVLRIHCAGCGGVVADVLVAGGEAPS